MSRVLASKGAANCLKRSRSNYPCGCSETISPSSTVTIDYKWSEDEYKATFPNVRFKYESFAQKKLKSFLSSSILLIKYSVSIFFLRVIYISFYHCCDATRYRKWDLVTTRLCFRDSPLSRHTIYAYCSWEKGQQTLPRSCARMHNGLLRRRSRRARKEQFVAFASRRE